MGASKQMSLKDYPDYVAAERRYFELQADRGMVQRELVAIGEARRGSIRPAESVPRVHRSALEVAASRLTTDPLPAEADADVVGERERELNARDRLLEEACRLQYKRMEELRYRYSGEIVERHRPAHTALVRAATEHLLALGHALLQEEAFRGELEGEGIVTSPQMRPMQLPSLGSLLDERSPLWAYLREAEEYFGIRRPKVSELEEFQRRGVAMAERERALTQETHRKADASVRERAAARRQRAAAR